MAMSANAATPWLVYWYAALRDPRGIWMRSPEPPRLISLLYSARASARTPSSPTSPSAPPPPTPTTSSSSSTPPPRGPQPDAPPPPHPHRQGDLED